MLPDPDLLSRMAAQGTALTPTSSVLQRTVPEVRDRPDSPGRRWYLRGARAHAPLVAAAAEAGVRILAGTDSLPHGRIVDEVRALAAAGLSHHDALAAASWSARSYLGLPGLLPNAPADAVVYEEDPRTDLDRLAHPPAAVLRGRPVRVRRS
ncbi:amidohydrolase family protein [Actinosynnema sp. NPDC053489]|uniref:amidohydrolase family protein n=1 Tax=Actinosynnema sp. NPDC053489 TaxID=3363916 RepID=UPI0037CB06F2